MRHCEGVVQAAAKRKIDGGGVGGRQRSCSGEGKTTVAEAVEEETTGSSGSVEKAAAGDGGAVFGEVASDTSKPMSAIEYLVAHKRLPQCDIDFILMEKRTRKPFAETSAFEHLAADASTTPEDLAAAAALHEAQQERSIRFQEFVAREYVTHGEVAVDDEYIARRVETEAFSEQLWEKGFAGMDLSDFADTSDDEGDEFGFVPAVTREEVKQRFGL